MTALARFLAFYAAIFAAFGVASPFLPTLLQQDGLQPGELGVVLAAGTAIRLVAGPLGGRLADRTGRAPLVLAGFTGAAALVALAYGPSRGMALLLVVSVAHAAVLAPLTPVADALTLGSARHHVAPATTARRAQNLIRSTTNCPHNAQRRAQPRPATIYLAPLRCEQWDGGKVSAS